ncbi:Uncharacterised protein [Suttonella indologenes]|uniref:Uncharacterized protein n=2 Tax=Suttonella indologenes TaxID=13276 RepID=A0A380MN33_9GAMM|nr:Uncharacterised protein [Suttonella indologenes]
MSSYSIIVSNPYGIFNSDNGSMRIDIPLDVFKRIMYDDEIDDVLLSQLSLVDQDEYSNDELSKIQKEINELIEKQLVTQKDMQELLNLLQFAIDNNRSVLFTPFNWDHIPLGKFN